MGNKKKRTIEVAMNQNHHSNAAIEMKDSEMEMIETNNQLNRPVEVKEEPQIKEEPQSVGELIDVPVPSWNNRGVVLVLGVDQSNGEYDFDDIDCDVKIEVKKEVEKKKEVAPKSNADSGSRRKDAEGNQHDLQQPKHQDEDDILPQVSRHGATKPKVCKVGDPKNVSKKHKCDQCEYFTDHKGHFNRHLLKHTGEKPHGCDLCPKRFSTKQNLRSHMKVHVEELLFHCQGCFQGFNEKDEKTVHEVNCKVPRYECHLCKKSFGSNNVYTRIHMRVHSGVKPFECTQCSKQFADERNLNRHSKLHAGPCSVRCSHCRMAFSHQDEKNAHWEKCDRDVFECYVCGKSFALNKSNLIRHMRTHSGETPFECQHCSKQFKTKFSLNGHMDFHTKTFPFKCLICRRGFSLEVKRKAHQRNCNRRCYECHLCNKFFHSHNTNLRGHMHIHSGKKLFQCELCRRTFTQKSNLKWHMKNIHHKKY